MSMDFWVNISTIAANIVVVFGIVIALIQLSKMRQSNELQKEELSKMAQSIEMQEKELSSMARSNEIQEKAMLADHERRKKEATIDMYQTIIGMPRTITKKLEDVFGKDRVNPSDSRFLQDDELQTMILRYLNLMERYCVGVNTGVYSIDLFSRMAGGSAIRTYKRLEPIIEERRQIKGSNSYYCEFEEVVAKLQEKRRAANPISTDGDIIHS